MESRIDYALLQKILSCKKCKEQSDLSKYFPRDCLPVCSFGDPLDDAGKPKKVFIVGINPSDAEYNGRRPHLKKSPKEEALKSQLKYFAEFFAERYGYFKKIEEFFNDKEINAKLGIESENVWERIGYLDLVKCVTKSSKSTQWNGLKKSEKKKIVKNCQYFLKRQLSPYKPRLIVGYGKDVGVWFKEGKPPSYEEEFNFIVNPRRFEFQYQVIYVPQRQGKHSRPEVNEVKSKIKQGLAEKRLERH